MSKPENQPKSSDWHNLAMTFIGFSLLLSGILIANHFITTIDDGAAFIFVVFFPLPMIVFGLVAIYSGYTKFVSSNNISAHTGTEAKEPLIVAGNAEIQRADKQDVANSTQINNPSFGSSLAYTFIILGIVICLLLIVVSTYTDINKGVTKLCGKAGSCTDIFIKDSQTHFYFALAVNAIKFLVFPVFLAFIVRNWLRSKD